MSGPVPDGGSDPADHERRRHFDVDPDDVLPAEIQRSSTRKLPLAWSAPVPPPPTVPAGWYPDPENEVGYRYGGIPSLRYFDGTMWTEHRAPMQRRPPTQHGYPPQQINIIQQVAAPAPPIYVKRGANHGMHLVLTILTCGLWLPIWIIDIIVSGG